MKKGITDEEATAIVARAAAASVVMQTKRGPRKRPSGFNIANRADREQLTKREINKQRNRLLVQGWGLLSEVDEGRLNAAHRIRAEHLWAAIETLKLAKAEIERLRASQDP